MVISLATQHVETSTFNGGSGEIPHYIITMGHLNASKLTFAAIFLTTASVTDT